MKINLNEFSLYLGGNRRIAPDAMPYNPPVEELFLPKEKPLFNNFGIKERSHKNPDVKILLKMVRLAQLL